MRPDTFTAKGLLVSLIIFIAASSLTVGCRSSQELRSSWTDEPIVVDGNLSDWEGKPTTYFEEEGAVIGLSNDSDYLYIHFRTKDAKWAGLIKRGGISLYVDNEAGEEKDFYVKFFDGPDMPMLGSGIGSDTDGASGDTSPADRKRPGIGGQAGQKRLLCFVKDRITEMPIATDGAHGPSAAYDTCWGFFSYEFAIPLKESVVRYYGLNSRTGNTISIGAVWGDMRSRMREDIGGKRPGGGKPPGGGGGRMPGGRPDGMEVPQKQEVWFKTTLSMPEEIETDPNIRSSTETR